MKTSAVFVALLTTFLPSMAVFADDDPSWSAPHAPYQITDNIYAVGTDGIGVYLITTPKGHILLDASTEKGGDVVEANIKSLGFKLKDIKYLIENHAHSDHVGGLAQLKKSTGAKIIASAGDKFGLEHGTLDSEANWVDTFTPVKVNKVIKDGEKLSLGDVQLQAVLTPGHTKGCTSWFMDSPDNGAVRKVAFVCSLTTAGNKLIANKIYPQIVEDFRTTFAKLKTKNADVLLIGHPVFANLEEKYLAKKSGKLDAFVDSNEFQKFVIKFEKQFEEKYDAEVKKLNPQNP